MDEKSENEHYREGYRDGYRDGASDARREAEKMLQDMISNGPPMPWAPGDTPPWMNTTK